MKRLLNNDEKARGSWTVCKLDFFCRSKIMKTNYQTVSRNIKEAIKVMDTAVRRCISKEY